MTKIVSILLLICLFPIFAIVALAIIIDDGFPLYFRQKRIGINNNEFWIYKFRTMKNETPDIPTHLVKEKQKYNTVIGPILRKLSIDELPQLINILKGEMSIVGPRPERPYFIEKLNKEYPFYQRRLKIRPGITGWAQIKQPFDTTVKDVRQKLKYDFYYIQNLSFRLDVKIIINTIWVVFWGHSR